MYMLHTYIHLLSIGCYITKHKKEFLGASVSHAHSEALLCVTSTISIVTIVVVLVEEEAELTEDEHNYKLPSCVTVKT